MKDLDYIEEFENKESEFNRLLVELESYDPERMKESDLYKLRQLKDRLEKISEELNELKRTVPSGDKTIDFD